MPTYTYHCNKCNHRFEIFSYIKDYNSSPVCEICNSNTDTIRMYAVDVQTQSASIKKSDSELKTIGDLAQRNSERMSDDEKIHLYHKHNSYKMDESQKQLPKGMNRIKKPEKPKWPGNSPKIKTKRKPKNG